ncbi:hypothetical protein NVV93_11375 [Pseudomonas sp. LS44]|uniref:type III secretion system co-regulatory protein PtrC n=1 Tax=Pseudomonas sp. LS44 TaxID=1357074 RepID=UPI00215B0EC4|nr:type III secretion system co-regulatory protein PtrC [Pseudomonas sp. LS44]UVE16223.1 hypothetical protein NVV93_11375 [Pseudomonas sp. LS44]
MNAIENLSCLSAYGVTYAHFEDCQLSFETELAFQLEDGSLLTLNMPTPPGERQAIRRELFRQTVC